MTASLKFNLSCKYSLNTILLYVCMLPVDFTTFICRSEVQCKIGLAAPRWVNAGYFVNHFSALIFRCSSRSMCSWKHMVKGSAMHSQLHKHLPQIVIDNTCRIQSHCTSCCIVAQTKATECGLFILFFKPSLWIRCARNLSFSSFFSLELVLCTFLRLWKS